MLNIYQDLTVQDVRETHKKIKPYILQTPLIRSYSLEEILNLKVYLKLEYLQPTRSFKVRGACSKALSLTEDGLKRGLITASGGNHGLGVCYAGKELGVPVTVYLPNNTAKEKLTKIEQWGGKAILWGEAWDEANEKALATVKTNKMTYIHPFDDIDVVRGQGTIALEILDQNPYLDAIIASVGGGGLISGIGVVAKQLKPEIQIFGAETVGCDAVTRSFKTGRLIKLSKITSIADTLGAKQTTKTTLDRIKAVVNDMNTVTDAEALHALKYLVDEEKILVEPATSCSIAALLNKKFDISKLDSICIILCGANVSIRQLKEWGVV